MRCRRYEVWVEIDNGDGDPLQILKGKCFTRRGAEWRLTSILGDMGLNLGLLMAKVYHDIEFRVTGEVRLTR